MHTTMTTKSKRYRAVEALWSQTQAQALWSETQAQPRAPSAQPRTPSTKPRTSTVKAQAPTVKAQAPGPSASALAQSRDLLFLRRVRKDADLFVSLIRRLQAGEVGVAEILVRAHYPMIRSVVSAHGRSLPAEHEDLMQEGRMALLEACARFDTEGEGKSLSYVWTYVRSYVRRYLCDLGEVVRVPVNRYKKDEGPYRYGRRHCMFFSELPVLMNDDMEYSFEEALVDDRPLADQVLEGVRIRDLGASVVGLLADLSPKEREVLRRRFLDARGEEPTLRLVGDQMGLCRERVRQLESQALRKIRGTTGLVPSSFEEWSELLSRKAKERS